MLAVATQLGCLEPVATSEPAPAETMTADYLAKADAQWTDDDTLTLSWSEVLACTVALAEGAQGGVVHFVDALWSLPLAIARLIYRLGEELVSRELDMIRAYTDAEALERVRMTNERDVRMLRELLLTIRRAIPELWHHLKQGSGWFDTLDRAEKIDFVCQVTGRMTFEIAAIILTDKGLSRLVGLSRLQLVDGVTGRLLDLATAGRFGYVSISAIEDIGEGITGERNRRWSDPASIFGPLGTPDIYESNRCRETPNIGCPSVVVEHNGNLIWLGDAEKWEDTSGDAYFDAIVLDALPLPTNAVEAEMVPGDITAPLIRDAEVLASLLQLPLLNASTPYRRVFLPGDSPVIAPQSDIFSELDSLLSELRIKWVTKLIYPSK